MDIVRCEAIIAEGQRQNDDDGDAARVENDLGQVALFGKVALGKAADDKRQHQMVGDHDRQCHAGDDHHGRCR